MKEYGIVLKETPLDEGLSLSDVRLMYAKLSGAEAIPIEIQGECSVAMGFINFTDAEMMNFDYSKLEELVRRTIDDVYLEAPTGEYEIPNLFGVSTLLIYRGDDEEENV